MSNLDKLLQWIDDEMPCGTCPAQDFCDKHQTDYPNCIELYKDWLDDKKDGDGE